MPARRRRSVVGLFDQSPELVVEGPERPKLERAATGFIGNAALATVAASAGRWPEARDYLARATAEHDPYTAFWKLPAWGPAWKDDQCAAIIRATPLFTRA